MLAASTAEDFAQFVYARFWKYAISRSGGDRYADAFPTLWLSAACGIRVAKLLVRLTDPSWRSSPAVLAAMIRTPSILITDDDFQFRETLRSVFEGRGYRTLLAGDGEEALDIVQRDDVHLILLDMHMPKLTGLETLKRIKQFRAVLPCILLSAGLDDSLIREAQSAAAFSVLSKPVSRLAITSTVDQALERVYRWS